MKKEAKRLRRSYSEGAKSMRFANLDFSLGLPNPRLTKRKMLAH
ncbi:MAG: hypothetical protein V4635_03610 [Bacteroidota bacterium]